MSRPPSEGARRPGSVARRRVCAPAGPAVKRRARAAGLDNRPVGSTTKSEARIVRENVFTFFNLVFAVLAICLLAVGSFGNMAFALIALCNTAIGIVQQMLFLCLAHKPQELYMFT